MLSNSRGTAILLNSVTRETFRGPPMIACSADYTQTFQSEAWTNLLALATVLDVPAFHIDYAHDGGASSLLAAISNLQRFYSAQSAEAWIHSSGTNNTAYPIAGPLFYFDRSTYLGNTTDFSAAGTGAFLARTVAEACCNIRRNHLYGHAMDGVWPVAGENLDRIQRPPIHAFSDVANTREYWLGSLLQAWRTGLIFAVGLLDFSLQYKAGLDRLSSWESTYPGISRHFLPTLMAGDSGNRLFDVIN